MSSRSKNNPSDPFSALAALRGSLPPGEEPTAAIAPEALAGKLVIQRERKGRGGKTVTLVRGVTLQGDALAAFARELRQALGTGGSVEDGAIVLAGDQCARAEAWLRQRGAMRVVIGN
jgi:translation initiation factor 1